MTSFTIHQNMEHLRHCILQVNTICSEVDLEDPRKVDEVNEYTGTCFRVQPDFLKNTPFYTENKIFFVTNFHVCDDADNREVYLRTAAMGKSMYTAFVEAVVPKLDVAILSIEENASHTKWFLPKLPDSYLQSIREAVLWPKRVSSKTRKVSTIGFPQGLENQVSSGWLAGRGSEEDEMLQLNLSLNSGNSGGPLFDTKGNVIGVCTATLGDSEAISFAVPSFCVIKYFERFYKEPYGRFPQWGFTLLPMTEAYQKVHNINGCGAVVKDVHPASSAKMLKEGDVIHSIAGHQLDMFGLMKDETRGSKINIHNTEFIMSLEDAEITFSRRESKRTTKLMPEPIPFKVAENFKEWCPTKVVEFGPFVFQNLSLNIMTSDVMPTGKNVKLLETVKNTRSMQEIVIISKIDPNSFIASIETPEAYDQVLSINRTKIKSIKDLKKAVADVKRMHKEGEKYFNLNTTSGNMWFTINKVISKKRKR